MQTKCKLQTEFNSPLVVLKYNSPNTSNNHEGLKSHTFRSWPAIPNCQSAKIPQTLS